MDESYAQKRGYRRGQSFDDLALSLGLSIPGLRKWARKGAIEGASLLRGKWVLHGPLTQSRINRIRGSLGLKPAISRVWKQRKAGFKRTDKITWGKREMSHLATKYAAARNLVEKTIPYSGADAGEKRRSVAIDAFHNLCDATIEFCTLPKRKFSYKRTPGYWEKLDACIPMIRLFIDIQGGSWRDHWIDVFLMILDKKNPVRVLGDHIIQVGFGMDIPMAKDPATRAMFVDYISMPSGRRRLDHIVEIARKHISEWDACVLSYTAERHRLEFAWSSERLPSRDVYENNSGRVITTPESSVDNESKNPRRVAGRSFEFDRQEEIDAEKMGYSMKQLLKMATALLVDFKGIGHPSDDEKYTEARKLLLLLRIFPVGLFVNRAAKRLIATGNPEPSRHEVARMTLPEMCLFIHQHDQKHFPETTAE